MAHKAACFLLAAFVLASVLFIPQSASAAGRTFTSVEAAKAALEASLVNGGTENAKIVWKSIVGDTIDIPDIFGQDNGYEVEHYFFTLHAAGTTPPFTSQADEAANLAGRIDCWDVRPSNPGGVDPQVYALYSKITDSTNINKYSQHVGSNPSENHLWFSIGPANPYGNGPWFPVWFDLGVYDTLEEVISAPNADQVHVTVQKDGQPMDATVSLWQGGEQKAALVKDDGGFYKEAENAALAGTYAIYVNGADTGKTITIVADETATATVNYYTVTFGVADAGAAVGSTIAAAVGDDPLASGDAVLEGTRVIIAATGEGADTYTYAWEVNGVPIPVTSATLTVTMDVAANLQCVVTGALDKVPTPKPPTPVTPTPVTPTPDALTPPPTGDAPRMWVWGAAALAVLNCGFLLMRKKRRNRA